MRHHGLPILPILPMLLAKMAIHLNPTDLRGLLYIQGYEEHDFIANKI
jgi:hypothetical protein